MILGCWKARGRPHSMLMEFRCGLAVQSPGVWKANWKKNNSIFWVFAILRYWRFIYFLLAFVLNIHSLYPFGCRLDLSCKISACCAFLCWVMIVFALFMSVSTTDRLCWRWWFATRKKYWDLMLIWSDIDIHCSRSSHSLPGVLVCPQKTFCVNILCVFDAGVYTVQVLVKLFCKQWSYFDEGVIYNHLMAGSGLSPELSVRAIPCTGSLLPPRSSSDDGQNLGKRYYHPVSAR